MSIRFISLIAVLLLGYTSRMHAQSQSNTTQIPVKAAKLDLSALDSLSEYAAMKTEGNRFRIEDFDGIDISAKVQALKTPNKLDLLFYDPANDLTSICYDFYSEETKGNEWLPCDLLPESPTGLFWVLSNDFKSFYIIRQGTYLDMQKFKLKASTTSKEEYIVQENGVDKYLMSGLKGKKQNEFYPLELLK